MALSVAILELPARFGAMDEAVADVDALLAAGPPTDLAVLPECALTGYVDEEGRCDLRAFAEPIDGPTRARMSLLARRHSTAISFPLVERAGDRLFNANAVIGPDGALLHHHRKRHPWYPEAWATPGDRPFSSFELAGVVLAVAICFDLHFLEEEAAEVLSRSDALLFPSAWVDDGDEDLRGPLFAHLSQRFGVAIVNANWGVGVPRVRGQGASRIVLPAEAHPQMIRARRSPCRLDTTIEARADPAR